MKNILLGLGILLAAALQPLRAQIQFESFDLPNGLHVILHQDNSNPLVAVSVLYHVGSKDEIPTRTGFAHFFEHLLFEGSENIGRGEYMQLIQSNGGALNANTSNDRTFYYEILPSNQLELGLWMESERMLHAKIDQVGVDTQREVVKEEKRQRVDNQPYASFLSEMFQRAFTQHNYRWVPIGSMDHLNASTLGEFMAFYKKYYVPNNATLSIAGDIDMAQTKAMITKYFGDIPAGATVQRPSAYEPPLGGEVVDTIYDNIQIPAVFAGYRMVSETHPDTYALQMLTTALSDGPSSRFSKRMVDQDQNALQVAAFPFAMEHHGVFIALALANGATSTGTLMTTMEDEIAKMQKEPLSEKEFTKLLNKVETDYVNRNSGVAGIAENLANYHVYYGDANLINTEIERFRTVTPADIQRVAQTYLKPENRVVLHYLPKSAQ
jgi:predicted Zn-dependent peptidase